MANNNLLYLFLVYKQNRDKGFIGLRVKKTCHRMMAGAVDRI